MKYKLINYKIIDTYTLQLCKLELQAILLNPLANYFLFLKRTQL